MYGSTHISGEKERSLLKKTAVQADRRQLRAARGKPDDDILS